MCSRILDKNAFPMALIQRRGMEAICWIRGRSLHITAELIQSILFVCKVLTYMYTGNLTGSKHCTVKHSDQAKHVRKTQ